MYAIELKLDSGSRVVRKKGRPLYSVKQIRGTAVIKQDERITEVIRANDASILVRALSRRFGPREYSLDEAAEIVRQLEE